MATERKFYLTKYTIEVLSEEPMGDNLTLADIEYAITEGSCVGRFDEESKTDLTGKQAADALLDMGSEPAFFQLNNDGEEEAFDADV